MAADVIRIQCGSIPSDVIERLILDALRVQGTPVSERLDTDTVETLHNMADDDTA